MKRIGAFGIAVLLLLVGTATLAMAQREGGGREQGKSHEGQQREAQPQRPPQQAQPPRAQQPQSPRPPQAQAPRPQQPQAPKTGPVRPTQGNYGGTYHGGVRANGPTYGGVHHSGVPQTRNQVRGGFVQSRAQAWDREHRSWAQRGGYAGYRIPPDRFRLYYGREHYFRIFGLPMNFVGGYPRFLYDGYWVTFADPWPEMWPVSWYETDDVFIEYVDDGYYLFNRTRPGPGIAVVFSF